MRYIGSKANLLSEIASVIPKRGGGSRIFCDLFAGTGVVGLHFKDRFRVLSNDLLFFSYVLQKAKIEINEKPGFSQLKKTLGEDPLVFLNNLHMNKYMALKEPLVYNEFSPGGAASRCYFTEENALRIDCIRQLIEEWKRDGLIDEPEFYYLLATLIEAVPSISNIAGTYGAFLKHWDPRTHKDLALKDLTLYNNHQENSAFNEDALQLIKRIAGDVLYLDPPYNSRQYLGNYHVLESIARYDYPNLFGTSGVRRDPNLSSDFCKTRSVAAAFETIISEADFKDVVVSYSNEGLISEPDLLRIIGTHCVAADPQIQRISYRRYSRVSNPNKSSVEELLIVGSK